MPKDSVVEMQFFTSEWSVPTSEVLPVVFTDGEIDRLVGERERPITLGNLQLELSALAMARRWSEMFTPRSVAAVSAPVDTVPSDVVCQLESEVKKLATQHLGTSAAVANSLEDGVVVFSVEYDAPEPFTDALLESLASIRAAFVTSIPEAHWGKFALHTRAR